MPVIAPPHDRSAETPLALRAAIALGLPMAGAMTVAGTYFGKEILICAGWMALSVVAVLFIRPAVGIALMTAAFLLAAYPTLLQSLGMLTINNLLGVCFVLLLGLHVVERRDLSFLRNRQVQIFLVIGVLLILGSMHASAIFPTLGKTVGRIGPHFASQAVPMVYVTVGGKSTAIPLRSRGHFSTLMDYYDHSTYYENPDCTGNAYIDATNGAWGVAPSVVVTLNGRRLMYTATSTEVIPGPEYQSYSNETGCVASVAEVPWVYPAGSTPIDVTAKWTPPFSIK